MSSDDNYDEWKKETIERIARALTSYWDPIRGYSTDPEDIEYAQAAIVFDLLIDMGWLTPDEAPKVLEENANGPVAPEGLEEWGGPSGGIIPTNPIPKGKPVVKNAVRVDAKGRTQEEVARDILKRLRERNI